MDGTGVPWVEFQLVNPAGQKTTLEGIVDTGFSGFLLLPGDRNATLKLPQSPVFARYILADGSQADLGHVRAKVVFGGKALKSDLIALSPFANAAILIGTQFLKRLGFGLFMRGGQVIVMDEDESLDDLKKIVAGWTLRKR